jgi:hypothetical protein
LLRYGRLKDEIADYIKFLERELESEIHGKDSVDLYECGTIGNHHSRVDVRGIGFLLFHNEYREVRKAMVYPVPDKDLAIYQITKRNPLKKSRILKNSGILYKDDGVLKRHVVF